MLLAGWLAGLLLRAIRYQPSCQNRGSASSNKKSEPRNSKADSSGPSSVHACPVHGVVPCPCMHVPAATKHRHITPPPQSPPDISARPAGRGGTRRSGKARPTADGLFRPCDRVRPHVLYCSPSARRGEARASIHPASSPLLLAARRAALRRPCRRGGTQSWPLPATDRTMSAAPGRLLGDRRRARAQRRSALLSLPQPTADTVHPARPCIESCMDLEAAQGFTSNPHRSLSVRPFCNSVHPFSIDGPSSFVRPARPLPVSISIEAPNVSFFSHVETVRRLCVGPVIT